MTILLERPVPAGAAEMESDRLRERCAVLEGEITRYAETLSCYGYPVEEDLALGEWAEEYLHVSSHARRDAEAERDAAQAAESAALETIATLNKRCESLDAKHTRILDEIRWRVVGLRPLDMWRSDNRARDATLAKVLAIIDEYRAGAVEKLGEGEPT